MTPKYELPINMYFTNHRLFNMLSTHLRLFILRIELALRRVSRSFSDNSVYVFWMGPHSSACDSYIFVIVLNLHFLTPLFSGYGIFFIFFYFRPSKFPALVGSCCTRDIASLSLFLGQPLWGVTSCIRCTRSTNHESF